VIHFRTFHCHLSLSLVKETPSTTAADLLLSPYILIICVISGVEMLLRFLVTDLFLLSHSRAVSKNSELRSAESLCSVFPMAVSHMSHRAN
jgi:hypothetical protein